MRKRLNYWRSKEKCFVAIVMAMSMVCGSTLGTNLIALANDAELCTVEVKNSEELQNVLNGVGVDEGATELVINLAEDYVDTMEVVIGAKSRLITASSIVCDAEDETQRYRTYESPLNGMQITINGNRNTFSGLKVVNGKQIGELVTDLNADGISDALDMSGLKNTFIGVTNAGEFSTDANLDGKSNVCDLVYMKRNLAEKETPVRDYYVNLDLAALHVNQLNFESKGVCIVFDENAENLVQAGNNNVVSFGSIQEISFTENAFKSADGYGLDIKSLDNNTTITITDNIFYNSENKHILVGDADVVVGINKWETIPTDASEIAVVEGNGSVTLADKQQNLEGNSIYNISYENTKEQDITSLPVTYLSGSEMAIPLLSDVNGYENIGWRLNGETITVLPEDLKEDITLTAEWKPITYTATFKDGKETVAEIPFTVESEGITNPAVPEKEGYESEWASYVLGAEDITVNVVRNPITYTATFKTGDEEIQKIQFNVETKGDVVAPKVPAKDGYTGEWETYSLGASDITIEAIYTPIEYVATFNDGDHIVEVPFTIETKKETLLQMELRERDGYIGVWENFEVEAKDIIVNAIWYTTKFENTESYMYRVGNGNAVQLGSLFKVETEAQSFDVDVTVTVQSGNATYTYVPEADDWTNSTLKFEATGIVEILFKVAEGDAYRLLLQVVDANNATGAASATANNVVLLNDCGFSSLEVSGGYTLYGNGFTMTCGSDSAALDMGYAFVTLNNGTLDNVQIVCPNYDYAALYKSNLTSSENRSETTDRTRYYNAKSGVMALGSSQILNSRISGGRASLNVSGGNIVVDNSQIELGAVASVLVGTADSLTLRDTTLVQKPTVSTHDSSKTLMGFSVLYLCDSNGNATPTTLEGTFVQQAWIDESDAKYVPSAGEDIVTTVLKEDTYLHDIDDNGTKESLNLGFAYMPEDPQKEVAEPTNITDNRTDKTSIPYEMKAVSLRIAIVSTTVYVYSYKNTNGTTETFKTEIEYVPNKYSDIITVNYADVAEGLSVGKSYGTNGWVYELNVDLDKASGYALDFSKMSMSVNGVLIDDFKVNGSAKPTSLVPVIAGGVTYTLTATLNGKEYTAFYKVTGTETSKESPSLVAANYEAGLCVASSSGGTWHGAAPALEGIQIKYWSVAEKQYKTINLSDYTPNTKGQLNGANTTWTYSPDNGDFTLTLTGGQVHSSNNVYAMPVVCNGKLYFVAASSKGLVNSGNSARTIPVSYSFKDNNNGDVLTFSHTWSVEENKDEQYKYSDFCNGTLTKLSSSSSGGGGCVTPDTLITLSNGRQVRVDSLNGNEQLLVWNMETGKFDSAPIMFVDSEFETQCEVVHLYFSDGTDVKVIYEHGFWDYDLNRYVYLDANAAQYIGHMFAKQNGDVLEKVQLVDVVIENVVAEAWSPVTAGHLCYFVNGMLSMPGGVGGLFNIFDVDAETMTYDYETMARDIETYGLFTYEELAQYVELPREMFDAAGGQYLKISIGKGNMTMDELITMIQRYNKFFE